MIVTEQDKLTLNIIKGDEILDKIPLLVLISILISGLYYGTVNAKTNDTPPYFEEKLAEVGYKSVADALDDFNIILTKNLSYRQEYHQLALLITLEGLVI